MSSESCVAMADLLVEYADGELPAADARRVAEHLAECADCRAELAALRRSLELAGDCWRRAAERAPSPGEYRGEPARRRISAAVTLAACAAALLVAVGLWLFSQGRLESRTVVPREIAHRPTEELPQENGDEIDRGKAIDVEAIDVEKLIACEGRAARLAASAKMLAAQPGLEHYARQAREYLVEVYGDTTVVKGLAWPPQ
jgi:ferric-dicitrate binding protein FerR (iron transport regulator)